MISINQFTEGTVIDKLAVIIEGYEASYFAFDLAAKLYLRDWIKTYKFDPYVFADSSYTKIGACKGEIKDHKTPLTP